MRPSSNALTAFILLLQLYASLTPISAQDTPLVPAVKFEAEPREESRPALIRGLIDPDLSKRQTYYSCPAPRYTCEYYYCCPNVNYRCCRGGSCCRPGYYCVLASNGIIGCCPNGRTCRGPANDPTTHYYSYTSTSTRTYTYDYPTTTRTTSYTSYTYPSVKPPSLDTTTSDSLPEPSPVLNTTTPLTPSTSRLSLIPTSETTPTAPNLTNAAIGRTEPLNFATFVILAISTFLCPVVGSNMMSMIL